MLVCLVTLVATAFWPTSGLAQVLDHPVITEVYTDPVGLNDGPVGSDVASQHQEYIEIYIPPCVDLMASLNCSALNLTFYEVEGDSGSSGVELMNYRFDLPTLQAGTFGKVVVLGWLKYVNDPPTALAGTSNTRIAMINGEVTSTGGAYDFIAINGNHFGGGVTNPNFSAVSAESFINVPNETRSGIVQNGSGVYLLVNRDAVGYVQLCDDKNLTGCASGGICRSDLITACTVGNTCGDGSKCLPVGAHPVLPDNTKGLSTSALLDSYAGNNDSKFRIDRQPTTCNDTPDNCNDLETILTDGGDFSLLTPQIPIEDTTRITPAIGNGYARKYADIAKTTEDNFVADDPVIDAMESYRLIRNDGPFYPTPGVAPLSTSAPQLSVAADVEQVFEVLSQTTGRPGILTASTGGAFDIDISVSGGTSSNASVATFSPGLTDANVVGQTFGFPSVAVTPAVGAAHLSSASASVTVSATNSVFGDPAVQNAAQAVTVTATILDPTTGLDKNSLPFQATVFLAIQPLRDEPGVLNEFLDSSVGAFIAAQPNAAFLGTVGNASFLLDPLGDLSNSLIWSSMTSDLPVLGEECTNWINPSGPVGRLDLAQTVLNSAEAKQNPAVAITTYFDSITQNTTLSGTVCDNNSGASCGAIGTTCNAGLGKCIAVCTPGAATKLQARVFNHPDIDTFGGSFSPTELVYFADNKGVVGSPRSGLSNATTSRTFELLIVDYNSFSAGNNRYESGLTDDFGIVVEVLDTEIGSPVLPGEFVFLSFTGGFQGADIDMLLGVDGDVIAHLIFLDLDNLHDELGIISLERIYVIDGSGTGEVDILEVFALNPVGGIQTNIISSTPATGRSLPRSSGNVIRLTFSQDITLPALGEVVIQELQPGGLFGADLAAGFTMSIENDMSANPRILRIEDTGASDLVHRTWYTISNTGSWPGVSAFDVQLVVQVGDADNDGAVSNVDASVINAVVPDFAPVDNDRRDIDGNGSVVNADVGFSNVNIPSFPVTKPTGH